MKKLLTVKKYQGKYLHYQVAKRGNIFHASSTGYCSRHANTNLERSLFACALL